MMICPRDWERARLGDLFQTQKGFAFKSAWYRDTGHPIVKVSDFTQDSIDASSLTRIPDEIAGKHLRYELREGDVVVQTVGSWPSNPASVVGKCIRVPRSADKTLLNQNAVRLDPNDRIGKRFLYYSLRSSKFCSYIVGTAQGAASQAAITLDAIRNYDLALPPLTAQRKIAAILSAYDDLIENNLRRIKILEEIAQDLYREWFVKFRFPGHQHARFTDSPLGRIPEGWEATTIGNITCYISRGLSPRYDDCSSSIVINQKCIRDHKLDLGLARRHSSRISPEKYAHFGDILINSTGVGTLGRVAQVYTALSDTTVDTHVSIVRPQSSEDIDYLGLALMDMESHFDSLGAGATGQTELRRDRISETEILLPPLALRNGLSSIVAPIRRLGVSLLAKNATLRRTRDLLLPRLISGEVDVSELDIAVPEEAGA